MVSKYTRPRLRSQRVKYKLVTPLCQEDNLLNALDTQV